jgi:hypothetical protein
MPHRDKFGILEVTVWIAGIHGSIELNHFLIGLVF